MFEIRASRSRRLLGMSRDNQAEFASMLALLAGTLGRIAHEIFTLQRTEILELEEPFFMGKVGSSTMPHKRNPAVLENVLALCAMSAASRRRSSRAWSRRMSATGGCFISGVEAIPRACELMATALHKTKYILENLIVYEKHMERNLFVQRAS